jgi:hypothetical protein
MQLDSEGGEFVNGQMTAVYAPADFPDVDQPDTRPPNTLLQTISNIAVYHISDTTDRHQQSKTWKRKIREILENHQEHILDFFTKPMPNSHPLRAAHILLTKYGKINPALTADLSKNPPVLLKDCIVDVSSKGLVALNEYMEGLIASKAKESPSNKWMSISRHLLDYMRDIGDELIRIDQRLRDQCSHLDSVVEKVQQIIDLPRPDLDGFDSMMETYIEKQFNNHPIHIIYWDYIYTLQKYTALRDILMPQRISNMSEPICCICMTEPIVMAMVPCGHTFCTNCSKRTLVCHVCRQTVTSRLRVFFG